MSKLLIKVSLPAGFTSTQATLQVSPGESVAQLQARLVQKFGTSGVKDDEFALSSPDGEILAPVSTKFDSNQLLSLICIGPNREKRSEPAKSPEKDRPKTWVDGEKVTNCMSPTCLAKFTITLRKHHCRVCGKVFCDDCCPKPPGKDRLCVVCLAGADNPTPRLTENGSFLLIDDFTTLSQPELEKYFEDFMEEKGIMKKAREPMRALNMGQKVQMLTQEASVLRAKKAAGGVQQSNNDPKYWVSILASENLKSSHLRLLRVNFRDSGKRWLRQFVEVDGKCMCFR